MQLIPFDEVSRRLALSRRTYLGLREIPLERIVGSVDRIDQTRAHDPATRGRSGDRRGSGALRVSTARHHADEHATDSPTKCG
jgi:hypothetical protein